jgi:hypothetical protein
MSGVGCPAEPGRSRQRDKVTSPDVSDCPYTA